MFDVYSSSIGWLIYRNIVAFEHDSQFNAFYFVTMWIIELVIMLQYKYNILFTFISYYLPWHMICNTIIHFLNISETFGRKCHFWNFEEGWCNLPLKSCSLELFCHNSNHMFGKCGFVLFAPSKWEKHIIIFQLLVK